MARLRDHPWILGLGVVGLVFALLLPFAHVLPPGELAHCWVVGWQIGAALLGLLLLVLLVGAVGGIFDQREPDLPPERKSSRPKVLAGTVLVLLGALAGAVALDGALHRGLPRGAWQRPFDAAAWHAGGTDRLERRTQMLGDLLERVIPRLSRPQAVALLGESDGIAGAPLAYVVGYGAWFDSLVLEIEYDEAGRYRGHRLRLS